MEGYAAEHLFDPTDDEQPVVPDDPATPRELPGLAGPTADDPLKLYVRQIGDGRLLTPVVYVLDVVRSAESNTSACAA